MPIRSTFSFFLASLLAVAQPLPSTLPLTEVGDQAAFMLDGIHSWLDRSLAASPSLRETLPPPAAREALATALGAHQQRTPFTQLELSPAIGSAPGLTIHHAQWPVLFEARAELTAAGLYLAPTSPPRCQAVVLPDASETPEQHAGLAPGLAPERQFALRLAASGCAVLVPALIDRDSTLSGAPGAKWTNQTHREFLHRMAYQMGRHIIGYEVQKALAAVDWMTRTHPQLPTGILGYGEGGLIALHAAALDTRLQATAISGYFGPREQLWQEPLYRNVHGLLRHFGDAELARLIAPRALVIEAGVGPIIDGPPPATPDRRGAAPG
ncbi:MAG: dienelactone hydrolase family protein, partial [Acidobacteria bacterium]|nr:dienelactone hydrolase family protein [Acidobacteriota bacterium]